MSVPYETYETTGKYILFLHIDTDTHYIKKCELLAGQSVAMVTYSVKKIIPTCSPMRLLIP